MLRNTSLKTLAITLALLGLYGVQSASIARADNAALITTLGQWLSQPALTIGSTAIPLAPLRTAYTTTNTQPFWVDADGLTPRGKAAFDILSRAGEEGLNPERYGLATLTALLAEKPASSDAALANRLSLELLTSTAIMRYSADMHAGVARHQWNTQRLHATPEEQTAMLMAAATAPDTAAYLRSLSPATPGYAALKTALAQHQAMAAQGGWPHFTKGATIKPGMSDDRIPTLRQILAMTGDLPATTAPSATPNLYDAATVAAVEQFQARHGLEADGAIGATTQAELAVPVSQRITQIAMTLERMRWMPRDLGTRYVLVNIPSYTLSAVAGDAQLSMNVVVGKTSSKTPLFSNQITDVILNPSWGVPPKIAMNEMLPKIRKNPNFLIDAGYTVTEHGGDGARTVDPTTVDWESVGRGNFRYSFRQNPGDGNALGKVKFNIPNSDNIYLHDTAQRNVFSRAERSLSHGCIRLGDPKAMTEFVLRQEGWSDEKIAAAYESDASRSIRVTPLPVHLVYWTSWVDGQGRTHFNRDVYGMDQSLLASLTAPQSSSIKLAAN